MSAAAWPVLGQGSVDDLLDEVRALRAVVHRSVDLHGAYRDSAAERARRITELHGVLDAEREGVERLQALDRQQRERIADLERRLGTAVRRARAAEEAVGDLRRQADAHRREREQLADAVEAHRVARSRDAVLRRSLRRRRSVRLVLWCCDRPSTRRLLRLLHLVGR